MFPPNDSQPRRPLPSPGSRRNLFPRFHGTMRRSDARPSLSPRFLVSLGDTIPCACVRLSAAARRRPAARSFRVGQPHASIYRDGEDRASQVPGGPSCVYALFLDPGGTGRTRSVRCADTAPAPSYGEGSHASVNFGARSPGLDTRCLRLAAGVAPTRRQTRFRLLTKLYRAGLVTCKAPSKGFDDDPYIPSSFPKLSWRKRRPIFAPRP